MHHASATPHAGGSIGRRPAIASNQGAVKFDFFFLVGFSSDKSVRLLTFGAD
jgi:hypothetical protein